MLSNTAGNSTRAIRPRISPVPAILGEPTAAEPAAASSSGLNSIKAPNLSMAMSTSMPLSNIL